MKEQKKDRSFVFVRCLAYNHEKYIEDALKGFVMQKTNFPFVVVIVNDASTDNTGNVIQNFINENFEMNGDGYYCEDTDYANIIHAYHKINKNCLFYFLSLKINHFGKISHRPYYKKYSDVAKYWAECEGDDYWTDPQKLQKQVDFLEEHEEYVLSFHDAKIIDEEGCLIAESKMERYYTNEMCRDWSAYDLMCGFTPPTPATVYRMSCYNKAIKVLMDAKNIVNSDTVLASIIGKYGKAKFHHDIANSVCRVHGGGIWQEKSALYKRLNGYKTFTYLQKIHNGNKEVKNYIFDTRYKLVVNIIKLTIKEGSIKIFFHYYFVLWGMLFKTLNYRDMYMINRDIAYWYKVRNV